MINTYHTSVAPPPVPPRFWKPQQQTPQLERPVLIPAQLPAPDNSRPLLRFLVGVVMLQFVMSVGGFLYLYYKQKESAAESPLSPQGRVGFPPSEHDTTYKALARMTVDKASNKNSSGYLEWDISHSVRKQVNYYKKSWLTILEPGDYFVYSRVTFSKGHPKQALTSRVKLRKTSSGEEEDVMMAYCSLNTSVLFPRLCTATQEDRITLERGNQLSVWVQDLSLVDYEEGATRFGIYKL